MENPEEMLLFPFSVPNLRVFRGKKNLTKNTLRLQRFIHNIRLKLIILSWRSLRALFFLFVQI